MEFNEEEYLAISGIQHYIFCRRQWALIHIEQIWQDNFKTVKGDIMHDRAHNHSIRDKKGDTYIVRALKVSSRLLGIVGECDVVEFKKSDDGVFIKNLGGKYIPCPVEYKSGSPREDLSNELQLCAQAICLEEMLCCDISEGFLYFGETKRREKVIFNDNLRNILFNSINEMRKMYKQKHTPKVKKDKKCNSCSLKDICLPKLNSNIDVKEYLKERCTD